MRYLIILVVISATLVACKKDKFTTAPQIKYKSVKPNFYYSNLPLQDLPVITLEVTDAEGDLSFVDGKDSAWIFVKNLFNNTRDSFQFPDMTGFTKSNFKFDLDFPVQGNIYGGGPGTNSRTDTIYYEIYITDIAKNKSNTVITTDPVYYIVP